MNTARRNPLLDVDLDGLERDLSELRIELEAGAGAADVAHLRRVELVGRLATLIGWGTAWIFPNPVSALAISTGIFARWTMIGHHVVHRGYDKVDGVPKRLTSSVFAKGWRRWWDWADWLDPESWRHEHNTLHHYKLGEVHDPDQPESNVASLRSSRLPRFARVAIVALLACVWKFAYYAPNTVRAKENHSRRREEGFKPIGFPSVAMWAPWTRPGRTTWWRCYLPYVLLHFVLLPLPFLLISPMAWGFALTNRALAEVITNLHSYLIIVPNHAGDDVFRFDSSIEGKGHFYFRQIVGTANYRTGGFANDFFHGFLNYQIEHHVFPDLTMRQYAIAQPRVEAICRKHGLPYVQESVWVRLRKLVRVLVGTDTMPHLP